MEEQNIYRTPRALMEDIFLLKIGGGMPTDDESLDERQVLYWVASFVAEMYAAEVAKARGIIDLVDRRLWQPICLTPEERPHVKGPLVPQPQLYVTACLPENLLSSFNTLLLKDVFRDRYQLKELPISTVRTGAAGYGGFPKKSNGWAASGPTLYVTLPFEDFNTENITALGVLMPTEQEIVDGADTPFLFLPEWLPTMRARAMELIGVVDQGAADAKNNGADFKSDKR